VASAGELTATLGKPLESSADERAHLVRDGRPVIGQPRPLLDRPHGLDDHEGIAGGGPPDAVGHLGRTGGLEMSARDRFDERSCF